MPSSGRLAICTIGHLCYAFPRAHVFPLRSRPDGVFERRGQTEASVDLARLAGLHHAAVICEIMLPVMLNNSLGSICLLRSRRSWLHEAGQEWNGRSQRERSVDTSSNKAPLKI